MISDVLELLSLQAAESNLTLSLDIDVKLPTRMVIDGMRVRQVLLNLVGNAIKFTDEGSLSVRVDYDEQDKSLFCKVCDTGIGISEDDRPKLFKRFSQVGSSLSRRHGGTGLGLAICKSLVEGMGGELGVSSTLGLGSTFWFRVPSASQTHQPPGGERVGLYDFEPLAGLRLLVADDDREVREGLYGVLGGGGLEVIVAEGAVEAVKLAHEVPLDVIILNPEFRDIHGRTVVRAIREGQGPNENVPIIALTPPDFTGRYEDCDLSLFDDNLAKCPEHAMLIETLTKWSTGQGIDIGGV